MARLLCIAYLASLLVAGARAEDVAGAAPKKPSALVEQMLPLAMEAEAPEVNLCSPCINLGSQGISLLLNYALNVGVIGGCSELCGHLHSKLEQTACDLACSFVGIKVFVKALNHTDLDPFFFCEEVKACPKAPDNAAIRLLSASAQPQSVAKGDDVQLSVALEVVNASGVGEFFFDVTGPVSQSISQGFVLASGISAGTTQLAVKLTPKDDESADPPLTWSAGSYSFSFKVCQGECGSKHPHSKVLGQISGNFTLTDSALTISI